MSVQELQTLPQHEVPWAAAAILHSMAAMPAEPSAQPGPAARAAEGVLHSCCMLSDSSAQSAVCQALRAAVQQHQLAAGETWSLLTLWRPIMLMMPSAGYDLLEAAWLACPSVFSTCWVG